MQHIASSVGECAEIIARQDPSNTDADTSKVLATALLFNLDNEKKNTHLLLPHKLMPVSAQACKELVEFLIRRKWDGLIGDKAQKLEVTKSAHKIEFAHKDDQWVFSLSPGRWWRLEFVPDPRGDCSICHERGPNVRTGCRHMFHRDCLLRWIGSSEHHDCPNCRAPLFTGARLERDDDDDDE